MPETLSQPAVVHIHIPKSAGTTINALLGEAIKGEHFAYSSPGNAERLRAMPQAARDEIDFLFGHFPYGLHALFTRPVQYVASIRRPAHRIISFYRFVLSRDDHPLHATLKANAASFASFLRFAASESTIREEIDNMQVRMLAGSMDLRDEYSDVASLALSHVRSKNFFVCDIDRLASLLAFLGETMGLRFGDVPRLNTSGQGHDVADEIARLGPAERELLDRFGRWDGVLYDAVVTGDALIAGGMPARQNIAAEEAAVVQDIVPALVRAIYRVLLLREPDAEGLATRIQHLRGGRPIEDVMRSVLRSPEFAQKHRRFLEAYLGAATDATKK